MPAAWPKVFLELETDGNPEVTSRGRALGVTFGDSAVRGLLRDVLADPQAEPARREHALAALLKVKDPRLAITLERLVSDPRLGGPAIRGLSAYELPSTPGLLVEAYPSLGLLQRRDALNTLAARKSSARALLAAVKDGRLPRGDLTADLVRQLRNLNDKDLNAELAEVWGTVPRDDRRPRALDRQVQGNAHEAPLAGA